MKNKGKVLIYRCLSYSSVFVAGMLINKETPVYLISLIFFLIFHTLENIEEKKWRG